MANDKLLKRVVRQYHRDLDLVNRDLLRLHVELARTLSPDMWESLDCMTYNRSAILSKNMQITHHNKLKRLVKVAGQNNVQRDASPVAPTPLIGKLSATVVNLSSHDLDECTKNALARGLNYSPTPDRLPIESIIASIEDTLFRNKVPGDDAECLRQDISTMLRKSKIPSSNIPRQEVQALRRLRKNEDILVLPADKGNATVVVNTAEYEAKVTELVSDAKTYKKVSYNPTARVTKKVMAILQTLPECEDINRLKPRNPTVPKIYGLPKIHKPNWPLRPIVSQINSPTYNLSRRMSNLLQPLTGKTSSYVRDSTHFTQLLDSVSLTEEEAMVSFDVTSLFTNVPVEETIEIIKDRIKENNIPTEYVRAIELCLKSGYLLWRGDFYTQIDGVAMGSPIAPVAANIFMEWFENEALSDAPYAPRYWWRYVDDVFAVVARDKLVALTSHLNSVHPKVKFTIEEEENGKLPFLDVLVIRRDDGRLQHTVYRKPTHTDRYLRADSHHHPQHLSSIPRTLINRALRLCDPEYVKAELGHVRSVLESNGFRWRQSWRVANSATNRRSPAVDRLPLYLPYIKGVTDRISYLLKKKYSIKTIFRPHAQLRQLLRSPKDKDPLNVPGVYMIPCECGKCYVGETQRNISTRITEHIRSLKNANSNTSAVTEHVMESGANHYIRFDKVSVLAREKFFIPRKIREAIEINRHPNFNRDSGWALSPSWKPLLRCVQSPSVLKVRDVDVVSAVCFPQDEIQQPLEPAVPHSPPAAPPPPPSARARRAAERSARRALNTDA